MSFMISATEEIRHSGSLIARYLRQEFPETSNLAAAFQRQIADAATLAPADPGSDYPWSMVGTAFDFRIRFLFEKRPVTQLPVFRSARWSINGSEGTALADQVPFSYGPNDVAIVYLPRVAAELFIALRDFLRRVRPARRYLPRDDEAWLCRYCAALALVDTKFALLRSHKHPLQSLPAGSTLDDLFVRIPREAVVDICKLSRQFQDITGREWLTQEVQFDPHIWVGHIGASPDVRVGDALLDLKTTIQPRLSRLWLDQLLLYALAIGDRRKITRLGFHLVRQGRTVSWPIEEFIARAAGRPGVDIERLSSEFFSVVTRSSRLAPKERWGKSGTNSRGGS